MTLFTSSSTIPKCKTDSARGSNEMERRLKAGQDIPGVLISEGRTWVEQRKFALRDFGFGKSSMEEMIREEVQLFTEEIRRSEGEPFDFINKFNLPILNALWNVM